MKKWSKAFLFILPLLCMVAAVNWYVDSYAYLRVTYDDIGRQMVVNSMNVSGLEESDFNDRNLMLACLKQQEAKELVVAGSSRVMNFDHTMFGTESFYNTGLSESTIYDLLAVTGILAQGGKLPDKMVIGVDAFLFNESHNNERWRDLEEYVFYFIGKMDEYDDQRSMEKLFPKETGIEKENTPRLLTGRHYEKWLSLDYFRYNVTLLPKRKRFMVDYTKEWETEQYLKHYDGSISYQKSLRDVAVENVEELTRQSIDEHVVYRMTDFHQIDEESMTLLSRLVGYLQGEGVEVMLYLPPYSPMMYNYIESEEQYQITFQIEERIRQMASEKGVALYGSYDPAGCGLRMSDLYDIYHIKTEKMMDTFYPVMGVSQEKGLDMIQ